MRLVWPRKLDSSAVFSFANVCVDPEVYNSTNRAMSLETTYRRKVPYHWLAGKFNRQQFDAFFFFFFFRKQALTFHANCLLKKTVCMKCQTRFSETNRKNIYFLRHLLIIFDCATGMCNYYFYLHLVKYCRGKSYYHINFSKRTRLYS